MEEMQIPHSNVEAETQALQLQQRLQIIAIVDQPTYDAAVSARTEATTWLKSARSFFKGLKDPAYAAWKNICSNENTVCDPVETTIQQINRELVRYDQEQERIRREEQARIDREARARAEAERLAQVEEMQAAGADEEAIDAALEEPVQITHVAVAAPTYEKSKSVVMRDNWSGECFDLFALVKAVAKDRSKIGLLQVNQQALNQMAKALKGTMAIPGCRPVNNTVVASGRG